MPGVKWVEPRHLVTMAENVKVTTAIGYTPVLTLAQIEEWLKQELDDCRKNGCYGMALLTDLLAQVQAWKEGK